MNTNDWIATWWITLGVTVSALDVTKYGTFVDDMIKEWKGGKAPFFITLIMVISNVLLMWPDSLYRMLKKAGANERK